MFIFNLPLYILMWAFIISLLLLFSAAATVGNGYRIDILWVNCWLAIHLSVYEDTLNTSLWIFSQILIHKMVETSMSWNNLLICSYEKSLMLSWETAICQHLISNYSYWETDNVTSLSNNVLIFFPLLVPENNRDDWTLLMLTTH